VVCAGEEAELSLDWEEQLIGAAENCV